MSGTIERRQASLTLSDGIRSSLRHLRPLNSFHLAPVLLFAFSQASSLTLERGLLIALVMHGFIYPSSAGYNSYFDRDTEATGGLSAPPPVHESLYWIVTAFDVIALSLAVFINPLFAAGILICIIASRAYSNDKVRIKAKPVFGYFWVVFFQGYFTYQMVFVAADDVGAAGLLSTLGSPAPILAGVFTSLLVAGSYPLTQVYQFEEDAKRGDRTIAMVLGYTGTFVWCFVALSIGFGCCVLYFILFDNITTLLLVSGLFLPSIVFCAWWFMQVRKDTAAANHTNAMRMANVSAWTGNAAFLILLALKHLG